ncbi:MAG: O-antigen ligase family protein [Verrucomicrobiales bacterium]
MGKARAAPLLAWPDTVAAAPVLSPPAWLGVGLVGVTAGYFLMPSAWEHRVWVLIGVVMPLIILRARAAWYLVSTSRLLVLGLVFQGWMAASWVMNGRAPSGLEVLVTFSNMGMLMAFSCATALVANDRRWLTRLRDVTIMAAVLAAVVSIIVYWVAGSPENVGARLRNWFVHGGQHPVPTGIQFAWAAAFAAVAAVGAPSGRNRWLWLGAVVVLTLAICCTQTRGALLGLGIALLALAAAHRFSGRGLLPLMLALVVVFSFQFAGPAAVQASMSRHSGTAPLPPVGQAERLSKDPLRQLVDRRDSGRVELYRQLLKRLQAPEKMFFGLGWWADHSCAQPDLHWKATHPHSAFLSTLYHGGQVGLILLCLVLAEAARRAWKRAIHQHSFEGLVLLALGTTTLIFDGESAVTFITEPRFEPLVLWFAVGLLAVRAANGEKKTGFQILPPS